MISVFFLLAKKKISKSRKNSARKKNRETRHPRKKNQEIAKKLSWKKKSGNTASRIFFSGNTSIATFVFPTSRLSTFVIPTLRFFFSRDAVFPEIFFQLSFFVIPDFFSGMPCFPIFFSGWGFSGFREKKNLTRPQSRDGA